MGPPHEGSIWRPIAPWANALPLSYVPLWLEREMAQWVHPMKDRSDDPSHHERTLYLWVTSRSGWNEKWLSGYVQDWGAWQRLAVLADHHEIASKPVQLQLVSLERQARTSAIGLVEVHCLQLKQERERERNVLFNDALNTFYLWLYGVRHMVKDHSDSEKGNPLPPHRLLFPINSKGSFICTIPQTG